MSDITRSESIKQLHRLKADINNGLAFVSKTKDKNLSLESLDMAIASLETDEAYGLEYEQPEFCKDCISREAVYYYISSHINEIITESGTDKNAHTNAILRSLANGVKTMPSVLPKVTKNDLGVDCISRVKVIDYLCKHCPDDGECFKDCDEIKHLRQMPSVTPQESKSEWEQDHAILKAYSDGANDVLDKIRAEIKAKCCITVGRENDGAITLYDVFEILDKYKAESEG